MIAVSLSVTGCSFLISKTYSKWQNNPVIVSLDEKSTSIHQIPFPAVTICPEIKSKLKFNEDEYALQNITQYYGESVPFNEVFYECIWRNMKVNCSKFFYKIKTDDGLCYTFNMLDQRDLLSKLVVETMRYLNHNHRSPNWTLQNGYKSPYYFEYPHRALDSGFSAGLELILIAKRNDITNDKPVPGFKLALHTPSDIPRFKKRFYRIPLNKEFLLSIEPKVMTTAPEIFDYKPRTRQCHFDGEQKMKYFRVYSQTNCELDYYIRFIILKCNCVRADLHHSRNVPICGKSKEICLKKTDSLWNRIIMGRVQVSKIYIY